MLNTSILDHAFEEKSPHPGKNILLLLSSFYFIHNLVENLILRILIISTTHESISWHLGMHGSKTLMNWTERNNDYPEAEREGLKKFKIHLKNMYYIKIY